MPVFDHRLAVFEQVSSVLLKLRRSAETEDRWFLQRNLQQR